MTLYDYLLLQETCDKVKDDGTVVYIAGPDPSLANNSSIFPNLEQNQVSRVVTNVSHFILIILIRLL